MLKKWATAGCAVIMALALALAGCGGGAGGSGGSGGSGASAPPDGGSSAGAPAAQGGASGEEEGSAAAVPPGITMFAQEYGGDGAIEVPLLEPAEGQEATDTLTEVNEAILAFAGDYEQYMAEEPGDGTWLELKCYPFRNEKYVQIVLTRAVYPAYATQGNIFSVCYDYQLDQIYTIDEAVEAEGLDFTTPEAGLTDVLDDAEKELGVASVSPAAFVLSQTGNAFFYKVAFNPAEQGEPQLEQIFARFADGSYDPYDGETLPLGNVGAELVPMDPPLACQK
ncbi:MAG: hypothetical protein LBR44_12420 [Clostridiales Family XIII bacterium]|jgi:hypothetical protein|nr:hypothetical protein [Clostridiales Family XIII bacterium]